MKWYAIHTQPRREALAQQSLVREGLETYFPKLKRRKTIRRVRKWVIGPLFPNYIFARFDYDRNHRLVKYANGVSTIVSFGGKPAIVDDTLVDGIRAHCQRSPDNHDLDVIVVQPQSFRAGELVEIKSGALMGLQGVFEREMPDKDRVVILLETLAKGAKVQVRREELERVES